MLIFSAAVLTFMETSTPLMPGGGFFERNRLDSLVEYESFESDWSCAGTTSHGNEIILMIPRDRIKQLITTRVGLEAQGSVVRRSATLANFGLEIHM